MQSDPPIHEGHIIRGPQFGEPMRVETLRASGDHTWVVGLVGLRTDQFRRVTLAAEDFQTISVEAADRTYDGDAD